MIIWSGYGIIVAVIAFISLMLTQLTVDGILNHGYYTAHGWPKLTAFILAGILTLLLGNYLNAKQGKVVIEKATGRELLLKPNHSLFFINIQYWGYIFFIIGLFAMFL